MRCRVSNPIPPLKRWPRFMDPCRTLSKKRIPDWDQERGKFSTISISHSLNYYYYYYFKATHTNRNTCTLFRQIDRQIYRMFKTGPLQSMPKKSYTNCCRKYYCIEKRHNTYLSRQGTEALIERGSNAPAPPPFFLKLVYKYIYTYMH